MLRHALNAISLLCAVAALVLVPMWVRSYHRADELCVGLLGHRLFLVASKEGCITTAFIGPTLDMDSKRWTVSSHLALNGRSFPLGSMRDYVGALGFGWIRDPIYVLDFDAPADFSVSWGSSGPAGHRITISNVTGDTTLSTTTILLNSTSTVVAKPGISGADFSASASIVLGMQGAGPIAPYWFLAILLCVVFTVTCLLRPWRYSVRSLLGAMTYAAILLTLAMLAAH